MTGETNSLSQHVFIIQLAMNVSVTSQKKGDGTVIC